MIGFMDTPPEQPTSDCSNPASGKMVHYEIFDDQKPWTANAERTWHYHKRADMVRRTRERFGWLTIRQRIPLLDQIVVVAEPHLRNSRSIPDVGACFPTVKAAIDGIVDAGVIVDDTAKHLTALVFLPPKVSGFDGLTIHVFAGHQHISEILAEIGDMA
jgi:hypothetical protein